jgi:threonine/homoserine/homoserine lactone efflux protein
MLSGRICSDCSNIREKHDMPFNSTAPLVLFAFVTTISPGGATTLATASGSQFGFKRSIPLITGMACGLASLSAGTAGGLAGLLLAAPSLQTGMKMLGTMYLLWLAWSLVRSGPPSSAPATVPPLTWIAGVFLLWLNPKAWAVTLGASASFAAAANEPVRVALVLGGTFGLAAALSLSIWCTAGVMIGRLISTPRQWRVLNAALAVLLAVSIIPMWYQA